jgi:hypothetical protein
VPGGNSLPYISRLCPSRHLIELGAIKPSIARSILQLDVLLIALGRTAWSVIKKLVQQGYGCFSSRNVSIAEARSAGFSSKDKCPEGFSALFAERIKSAKS